MQYVNQKKSKNSGSGQKSGRTRRSFRKKPPHQSALWAASFPVRGSPNALSVSLRSTAPPEGEPSFTWGARTFLLPPPLGEVPQCAHALSSCLPLWGRCPSGHTGAESRKVRCRSASHGKDVNGIHSHRERCSHCEVAPAGADTSYRPKSPTSASLAALEGSTWPGRLKVFHAEGAVPTQPDGAFQG